MAHLRGNTHICQVIPSPLPKILKRQWAPNMHLVEPVLVVVPVGLGLALDPALAVRDAGPRDGGQGDTRLLTQELLLLVGAACVDTLVPKTIIYNLYIWIERVSHSQ